MDNDAKGVAAAAIAALVIKFLLEFVMTAIFYCEINFKALKGWG